HLPARHVSERDELGAPTNSGAIGAVVIADHPCIPDEHDGSVLARDVDRSYAEVAAIRSAETDDILVGFEDLSGAVPFQQLEAYHARGGTTLRPGGGDVPGSAVPRG